MDVNLVIERVKNVIITELNPLKIIFFGSRIKKTNYKGSDIDIAIESDNIDIREERKLKEKIEKISGLYSVDIVFLNKISDEMKNHIFETGVVIYEKK